MKRDSKGYAFPTPIDPQATVCIRVQVPAHPLYIGAFFNAYRFFGKWNAWEKDADHTGKDVAAIWQPAIAATIAEWDAMQGECGMINVRQSPTDPCKLEAQYTPGGAWVEFADMLLCKLSGKTPLYGAGEGWKEVDDVLWHLKTKTEQIDIWLDSGLSESQIKILLGPQSAHMPFLPRMVGNMAAMTTVERDAALAAIDYQAVRETIACINECDANYSLENYSLWVHCINQTLADAFKLFDYAIYEGILNIAQMFSSDEVVWEWGSAMGGSGFGFGGIQPVCDEWYVDYDFSISQHGWEVSESLGGGQYSGGAWQTTDTDYGQTRRHIYIKKQLDAGVRQVTRMRVTYDMQKGVILDPPAINCIFMARDDGTLVLFTQNSDQLTNGSGIQRIWQGSVDGDAKVFRTQIMCSLWNTLGGLTGSCVLHRVELWGTGDPPGA